MRIAFTNARLLDGNGGPASEGATVVVDGSRLAHVGQSRDFGDSVQVVDVGGRTVLPGLVDAHVHFAGWGQWLAAVQQEPLMLLAARSVEAMRTSLEAGCTTARDLGGLEAGFVQAVEQGLIAGPRLQSALVVINPTNGLQDRFSATGGTVTAQGLHLKTPGIPLPWCDGVDQARAKVREVLRAGADLVKVAATASLVSSSKLQKGRPLFTREELDAIVDEAHRAGVQVACHAHGGVGLKDAVRAGVDTIEHGAGLDEEAAEEMAHRGTWLVPTLAIYYWHSTLSPEPVRPLARELQQGHKQAFALARRAGVRIAMGTDSNETHGHGKTAEELDLLVQAGMTPGEAISASTRRAAECLGWADRLGTLEVGKEADLLIVDGNPLVDIGVLRQRARLSLVMQGGRAVGGTWHRSPLEQAGLAGAPTGPDRADIFPGFTASQRSASAG